MGGISYRCPRCKGKLEISGREMGIWKCKKCKKIWELGITGWIFIRQAPW